MLDSPSQVKELQQALGILLGQGSGRIGSSTSAYTSSSRAGSNGSSSSSLGTASSLQATSSNSSSTATGNSAVAREMTGQVVDALMGLAAGRLSVPVDTLFPMRRSLLSALQ